jgi:hypothetical protein
MPGRTFTMSKKLNVGDRVEAPEGARGFAERMTGRVTRVDEATRSATVAINPGAEHAFLVTFDPDLLRRVE